MYTYIPTLMPGRYTQKQSQIAALATSKGTGAKYTSLTLLNCVMNLHILATSLNIKPHFPLEAVVAKVLVGVKVPLVLTFQI